MIATQRVSRALTEAIGGVLDAQKEVGEGAAINPWVHSRTTVAGTNVRLEHMEFDVAVTVSDERSGGGKIGVSVVGLEGTKSTSEQTSNRLRFKVPLAWPLDPNSK